MNAALNSCQAWKCKELWNYMIFKQEREIYICNFISKLYLETPRYLGKPLEKALLFLQMLTYVRACKSHAFKYPYCNRDIPSERHQIVFLWNHMHLFQISGVITNLERKIEDQLIRINEYQTPWQNKLSAGCNKQAQKEVAWNNLSDIDAWIKKTNFHVKHLWIGFTYIFYAFETCLETHNVNPSLGNSKIRTHIFLENVTSWYLFNFLRKKKGTSRRQFILVLQAMETHSN